jgi:hypothetical protein
MQQRPVLEKVQMPPRLVHGVMHRTATDGGGDGCLVEPIQPIIFVHDELVESRRP